MIYILVFLKKGGVTW